MQQQVDSFIQRGVDRSAPEAVCVGNCEQEEATEQKEEQLNRQQQGEAITSSKPQMHSVIKPFKRREKMLSTRFNWGGCCNLD